jgi:hypothetical protein
MTEARLADGEHESNLGYCPMISFWAILGSCSICISGFVDSMTQTPHLAFSSKPSVFHSFIWEK